MITSLIHLLLSLMRSFKNSYLLSVPSNILGRTRYVIVSACETHADREIIFYVLFIIKDKTAYM